MLHHRKVTKLLLPCLVSLLSISHAMADVQVYGPGGPAPAMKAAAKQFSQDTGIVVNVTAGPTNNWAEQAKKDADLIYSGSEAMMTDFESLFTKQIIKTTVEPIYLRPAAILVRENNPKNIRGFKDLTKPNMKVLVTHGAGQVGMWEDIAGRTGDLDMIRSFRNNIVMFAPNTGVAKKVWQEGDDFDAWLVFNIWGMGSPNIGQLIEVEPEYRIYRDTGVAYTYKGKANPQTLQFREFLTSPTGQAIFKQHGWQR